MKFSFAKPSPLACLLYLSACSSNPPPVVPSNNERSEDPQFTQVELSLAELERQEFQNPESTELKLRLARKHWCEGRRGMAFEAWAWVAKFGAENLFRKQAQLYLAEAKAAPSELGAKLGCKTLKEEG